MSGRILFVSLRPSEVWLAALDVEETGRGPAQITLRGSLKSVIDDDEPELETGESLSLLEATASIRRQSPNVIGGMSFIPPIQIPDLGINDPASIMINADLSADEFDRVWATLAASTGKQKTELLVRAGPIAANGLGSIWLNKQQSTISLLSLKIRFFYADVGRAE